MQINEKCLPCLVNQAVRVAEMTGAQNRPELYRKIFMNFAGADFSLTAPELIGQNFRVLTQHIGNPDPYRDLRLHYDHLLLQLLPELERRVEAAANPFAEAVKYAIVGNIIDFNPMHMKTEAEILASFARAQERSLTIDASAQMLADLRAAKTILYIGDNCGEVCLDKLLLARIRRETPDAQLYFAVRGAPVVNDAIEEDARVAGIDEFAHILSNGDDSLGTVLHRVSAQFRAVYDAADVIIAKGQANYESLSEEKRNIYFLLMVKCDVLSAYTGVPAGSLICQQSDKEG